MRICFATKNLRFFNSLISLHILDFCTELAAEVGADATARACCAMPFSRHPAIDF
jgi:hypothetical protein